MLSKVNLKQQLSQKTPQTQVSVDSKKEKVLYGAIAQGKPELLQAQLKEKTPYINEEGLLCYKLRKDLDISPELAAKILHVSCANAISAKSKAAELDKEIKSSDSYQKWYTLDYFRNLDKCAIVLAALKLDFRDRLEQETLKTSAELEKLKVDDTSEQTLQEYQQAMHKQFESKMQDRDQLLEKEKKYLIFIAVFLYYCKQADIDLASVNSSKEHFFTLFSNLVSLNEIKIAQLMFDLDIPIVDRSGNKKETLKYLVTKWVSNEIFRLVIDRANLNDVCYQEEGRFNLFEYACFVNDKEKLHILACIVEEKAGSDVLAHMAGLALFTAIEFKRDLALIKQLIGYSALLNIKCNAEITSAEVACYLGYDSACDLLISHGADATNVNRYRQNLMNQQLAAQRKRQEEEFKEVKCALQDFKPVIDDAKIKVRDLYVKTLSGQSNLRSAARYTTLQKELRPALLKAIGNADTKEILELISKGADINYRGEKHVMESEYIHFGVSMVNAAEMPPLFFAALYSDKRAMMVQLLIDLGASVIETNEYTQAHYSKDINNFIKMTVADSSLNAVVQHNDWVALAKTDVELRTRLKPPSVSAMGLSGVMSRPSQHYREPPPATLKHSI